MAPVRWDELAAAFHLPEHHLWHAVLLEAISCLMSSDRQTRRDAEAWLFESKSQEEFSFRWVCDHLFDDPQGMRERIRNTVRRDPKLISKRLRALKYNRPKNRDGGRRYAFRRVPGRGD